MATVQSPPILIFTPGGGVPVGPVSNPPVYSQAGTTQLVEGQAYIDVVFGSIQTTDEWVLVGCIVMNEIDAEPLNIWPGIITDKTAAGFRLQLNGMPDSGNYYLHWAVSGVNIKPSPATTYSLTGPSSGGLSVASSGFTVALPPSTTLATSVTVTPDDGGDGGTFTPSSVTLTTGSPSKTFTYTPASYGAKTISTTNSGPLSNPASIVFTCISSTYTLSGPSTGAVSVASTDFTAALPVGGAVTGTVTVTPSDGGGGGTFTPTSVGLTTAAPSATFTYTPASNGAKTISVTNNGGLTNPGDLTYTVGPLPLSDGDPISTWLDSSGNGHDATGSGATRPTFKTSIVNSKPVVRFTSAGSSQLNLASAISGTSPWTVFAVMKPAGAGSSMQSLMGGSVAGACGPFYDGSSHLFIADFAGYCFGAFAGTGAFHVFTDKSAPVGTYAIWIDGTTVGGLTPGAAPATGNFDAIGWRNGSIYSDGDLAEVIIYNTSVSSTDRANIEKYLGDKYGITVAGGSAVQPDTVTGLQGWWKADSL